MNDDPTILDRFSRFIPMEQMNYEHSEKYNFDSTSFIYQTAYKAAQFNIFRNGPFPEGQEAVDLGCDAVVIIYLSLQSSEELLGSLNGQRLPLDRRETNCWVDLFFSLLNGEQKDFTFKHLLSFENLTALIDRAFQIENRGTPLYQSLVAFLAGTIVRLLYHYRKRAKPKGRKAEARNRRTEFFKKEYGHLNNILHKSHLDYMWLSCYDKITSECIPLTERKPRPPQEKPEPTSLREEQRPDYLAALLDKSPKFGTYAENVAKLEGEKDEFIRQFARRFLEALKLEMQSPSRKHGTIDEKRILVDWANSEVKRMGLVFKNPKIDQPAMLIVDTGNDSKLGRFQLRTEKEDSGTDKQETFSTPDLLKLLDNLELMEAPPRQEGWNAYRRKKAAGQQPGSART